MDQVSVESVKELLPDGTYARIAEVTNKRRNTIAQFFTGRARVSKETKKKILQAAADAMEERAGEMLSVAAAIRKE